MLAGRQADADHVGPHRQDTRGLDVEGKRAVLADLRG